MLCESFVRDLRDELLRHHVDGSNVQRDCRMLYALFDDGVVCRLTVQWNAEIDGPPRLWWHDRNLHNIAARDKTKSRVELDLPNRLNGYGYVLLNDHTSVPRLASLVNMAISNPKQAAHQLMMLQGADMRLSS